MPRNPRTSVSENRETKITPEIWEYQRTLSIYLALKASPAFAGIELDTVEKFDIELTLLTPYFLQLIDSDGKYKDKFNNTWKTVQKELEKKLQNAQETIYAEIEHVKEIKKNHPSDWRDIHLKEMKDYLTKIKQTNQTYI